MRSPLAPLSYGLCGYHAGDYAKHSQWIANLQELGFRWVTFVPTWFVHDEVPPRLGEEHGPPMPEIEEAVAAFAGAGFSIKMEPHLDWVQIIHGPYEWRRRLYIDPQGWYSERILVPLATMLEQARTRGIRTQFSLGSELAVSLAQYGARWEAVLDQLRRDYPGLSFGHNIDPDSLNPGTEIRRPLNEERARRGLAVIDWREHKQALEDVHHYLGQLDYVGFSFYPNARAGRSMPWWREQTTSLKVRIVGRTLQSELQTLYSRLRRTAGEKPQFLIGEFGIGNADPSKPYETAAQSFLCEDGTLDRGGVETRRKYHLALLECLRKAPHLVGDRPTTYWTVTHYDFLGALEQPGFELWSDPILRQAVQQYNTGR